MYCKCQSNFSLRPTQMPQASCVAEKETFYSADFNVSYYLHVAVWHNCLSLSVCLGSYQAHHSVYYEDVNA